MDTKMKILDEGIMNLPYDLKVLIFKIYVLYNPRVIFDIYFNDEYLKETREIEYSGFSTGTYIREKKMYSLYNLIVQYELFKLKFKDVPLYYKIVKDENDFGLYNMKDLIEKLLNQSKKKYKKFKKRREYEGDRIDYSFKEILQLDLYPEDLINEGWDYNGNIGQIIQNNNFTIESYMENCRDMEIPFDIIYRF